MTTPTPRISAPYLSPFTNQTVRILGKVTQLRGETAVVDAGGPIDVVLNRVCVSAPTFRILSFHLVPFHT